MDDLPEIMFVDDNPGDSELVQEAFRQYEVKARFTLIDNGNKALALLTSRLESGEPLPALVLLDVNLPVKSGHDVLRDIRLDPRMHDLQVIMLSSSERRKDIERSEQLQATSYVIKPSNWDEYLVLVRSFEQRIKRRELPIETSVTPPPALPGLE